MLGWLAFALQKFLILKAFNKIVKMLILNFKYVKLLNAIKKYKLKHEITKPDNLFNW